MTHTHNRRFVGTQKLYPAFAQFGTSHAYVIGVGGVGSWAAEALARTGIGQITLIDMDILTQSNINRQLPATTDTLGLSKIDVMQHRITSINPDCIVHCVDDFVSPQNVATLLPTKQPNAIVLDCTDDINAKVAIALHCRFNKLKLIVSGGAGGKIDPTQIGVHDLKDVHQDPLLAKLRHKLRACNINAHLKEKFHIKCVYSSETPKTHACHTGNLHCGGYGSAVVVTSVIGMTMTAEALKWLGK